MDYRSIAAQEAAKLVKANDRIGLGFGGSVALLATALAQVEELKHTLTITTPSPVTKKMLTDLGFSVTDPGSLSHLHIYFDGCDQLDRELNALKSGGGIHSYEKAVAAIASEFVIIIDESKLVDRLNTRFPLTVEVLPMSQANITAKLSADFPEASVRLRMDKEGSQPAITIGGNLLLDVHFQTLPDLHQLNRIKMLSGVLDHSLCYSIVTSAFVGGPDGVQVLHRR
jgi:ribose 5-phosphate isomerase A